MLLGLELNVDNTQSIHDGFLAFSDWNTFLNGADRVSLDTHPYFAFDGPNDAALETFIPRPCTRWGDAINVTQSTFGVITAGEWSVAVNDCGLFVVGVGAPTNYGGAGGCDRWNNWETWDQATKDGLKQFALSTMDALQNWFFWTWKIGPSATDNAVRAPFWSYKLGIENGWLPTDPRDSIGACARQGQGGTPFDGVHPAWATGGAGANEFQAAATATLTWPPTSLNPSYPVAQYLPTYTPTGTHTTLAVPHVTAGGVSAGDGWFNDNDQAPLMVPIQSCSYPDAYGGALLPQPTVPFCGNAQTVAIPTPMAILTVDDNGLPFTTTVLQYTEVPGEVTVPFEISSSTTVAPRRRFAPRAGMPVPTWA